MGHVNINKVLFYVAFIKHLLKIDFVQGIVISSAGDRTLHFFNASQFLKSSNTSHFILTTILRNLYRVYSFPFSLTDEKTVLTCLSDLF